VVNNHGSHISPPSRATSLPNGKNDPIRGGDANDLLTGMILQVDGPCENVSPIENENGGFPLPC